MGSGIRPSPRTSWSTSRASDAALVREPGDPRPPPDTRVRHHAVRKTYPPLSSAETDEAIQARLDRQVLLKREEPPMMNFIIEECVLHRHMGEPEMMRQQIAHLAVRRSPFLGLQVMLTGTDAHAGLAGPLVLLETPDHDHLAYIEGQHNGFLVDDPNMVSSYQRIWDAAVAGPLSPKDKRLLDTLLE
ncbi:DUF5753 domain-containing protein [Streptomyces albidoflavus]